MAPPQTEHRMISQSSVPWIFSPPVLKVGVQDKLVQESGTLETRDDENNVDGVDLDVARKNNLDDFTDLLHK